MRQALTFVVAFFLCSCSPADEQPSSPAAAPAETSGPGTVTGTAPRGAIVALVPDAGEEALPAGPAVMDQYAKTFVPNLLYVRVGQRVEFRNSEDMPHNVNVTRRGSGSAIFSVATEPQQKYAHAFDRAGQYDVACDIHPGMQAIVVAARSSLVAIADEQGSFSIGNVPAGSYKAVWTFEGSSYEQALEVKGARTEVRIAQQ
jgi:plastocyanin